MGPPRGPPDRLRQASSGLHRLERRAALTSRETEVPLSGGMSTPGVVRVSDTVRRPVKPDADYVHALLDYFEGVGFDGAPRFLGIDSKSRAVFTYIEGFAPPHNGFELPEEGVAAGARLLRAVHDLTAGTPFAAGAEVACHPSLSQPNFVFRDLVPVAIIDWDGTKPGTRLENLAALLWAFVHPAVYGEGQPAARMLRVATESYGWSSAGLVDAMLEGVREFQGIVRGDPGAMKWAVDELAYMERNADEFRVALER